MPRRGGGGARVGRSMELRNGIGKGNGIGKERGVGGIYKGRPRGMIKPVVLEFN